MKCENCGAEFKKKLRYCPDCGMDIPEYKPLQNKYLRGEYQEEEFLVEEYNHSDDSIHHQESQNGENEYQNMEYKDYEVSESNGSGWSLIFLLLIVALLIGFVLGFIFFAGKLMNIPAVP